MPISGQNTHSRRYPIGTVISIKPTSTSSQVTYYCGANPNLDYVGVESNPDCMAGLLARIDAFWKACQSSGPSKRNVFRDVSCKNSVRVKYSVEDTYSGMKKIGIICGYSGSDIKEKFFKKEAPLPAESAYNLYAMVPTPTPEPEPEPTPEPEPPSPTPKTLPVDPKSVGVGSCCVLFNVTKSVCLVPGQIYRIARK